MRKTIVVIADSFHERYLIDSGLLDTSREDLSFYVFEAGYPLLNKYRGRAFNEVQLSRFNRVLIGAVLYSSRVFSETVNRKTEKLSIAKRTVYRLLNLITPILKYTIDSRAEVKALKQDNASKVILSTPFQKHNDLRIGVAALKLGIEIESYVYSWDNLTAKGPFIFKLDKIHVWNDIMKSEAIRYHEMKPRNISVIGVPLYSYIYNKYLLDNGNFEEMPWDKFGFKILLATIPGYYYGNGHLLLAQKIVNILGKNECLIIRPHPLDELDYSSLQSPQVFIDNYTDSPRGSLKTFQFRKNSIDHYFAVLNSSDVVINVASTVTIDAAVVGTPTINIAFSCDDNIKSTTVKSYYNYTHYKKVMEYDEVNVANDYTELIDLIKSRPKKIENSKLAKDFGGPYYL